MLKRAGLAILHRSTDKFRTIPKRIPPPRLS
jgi:hypothetical protein